MNFNPTFVGQITSNGQQPNASGTPLYLLARVTHVVNGPFFQGTQFPDPNYNNPSDIGSILYTLVNTTQEKKYSILNYQIGLLVSRISILVLE